jgi:hypothetical protein
LFNKKRNAINDHYYIKKMAELSTVLKNTHKSRIKKHEIKELAKSIDEKKYTGKYVSAAGDIARPKNHEQNYLVVSYVTPDGSTIVKSIRGICFKFSGTFRLLEEAKAHAKCIRDENSMFDVFVVDLYVWGVIPLPDEDRPFICSEYSDPLLTQAMAGIQSSMSQGKKEMDERKARDRAKAERHMQISRGKDYVMPEKSADILALEQKIKDERKAEEELAAAECRESEILFTMTQVSNIIMLFCMDNNGKNVNIDSVHASNITRYFASKSIELEAQARRAKASEVKGEEPVGQIPSYESIDNTPIKNK